MIYRAIKYVLLALLKAPGEPPEPPAGSAASVQVFRASPKFLTYRLTILGVAVAVLTLGTLVVALLVSLDKNAPPPFRVLLWGLPALCLLFGLVGYCGARLDYDLRYYILTDRSLRIREGVWSITEVTLTFANVQHLEVKQGPIQQMLGISDLIVRTAGGAGVQVAMQQAGQSTRGHRGVLRGIENAAAVRDQINRHLKQYRHAGLGDPEERRTARAAALARWSPQALRLLAEVRDELRAWRAARARSKPPGGSTTTS